MAPPKNHQRKPDRTPSKLPLKKPKLTFGTAEAMDECHSSRDDGNEVTHIGQAMAAPMAKKLSFEGDDSTENEPPKWFKHYEMRLDQRWSKLDQVVERFETLVLKVEEHDKKLDSVQFDMNAMNDRMKDMEKENEELYLKLDDLENRGRRINLIFYNVPEKPDNAREDCLETVTDIINNFVGFEQPCEAIIERCHRTGQKRDKPRIIHVAFASYAIREKVRKACIAKFKQSESSYKGTQIHVGEDFSKRIVQLRKAKMTRFRALRYEGKRPFFVFPAALKYRVDGKLISAD